ncbi:uncharacterized protein LOC121385579 [Gigantopelta aegis]|uniref:uncharacterized protein LOC121385579 n=1 Tax=Gigantopelta aegis TaxID=1735272 RepID=UPI001B888EAA|nr:uncharacterized protein LOC121385579 [Gigantopelta aegis]
MHVIALLCVVSLVGSAFSQHKPHQESLINLLKHVHRQPYFHQLPESEQLLLVELLAEGQVGQLDHFIKTVGADRIRTLANHLPDNEKHHLIQYIKTHHESTKPPLHVVTTTSSWLRRRRVITKQ